MIVQGAKKIVVCTNEICVPAQHTYESAGFQFVKKSEETFCPEYAGQRIHYEIVVDFYNSLYCEANSSYQNGKNELSNQIDFS